MTLKDEKPLHKSKTVHGNIISILGTALSLGLIVGTGGIAAPVLATAAGISGISIIGNIMSIFGRVSAEQKIR